MALFPLGILSAAGAGGAVGDYELISTSLITTNTPSVVFGSLGTYSTTYKHLQIRYAGNITATNSIVINYNSGGTYSNHRLEGNGSTVSSGSGISESYGDVGYTISGGSSLVCDILDPFSSTKNTTARSMSFGHNSAFSAVGIRFVSHAWLSTASVTSITFGLTGGASFTAGTRVSLYGIKG
jgi:hypothetical protein